MRAERRPEEPCDIRPGESNYAAAQVPYGVDLAAAWSWRFLVWSRAGYVVARGIAMFSVVVLPAGDRAAADRAGRAAWSTRWCGCASRAGVAALLVVLGSIALVALLLTFAGQQIAQGASDLAKQVVTGLEQIRDWLKTGPLHASDSQINAYIDVRPGRGHVLATPRSSAGSPRSAPRSATSSPGFFIILFATYFFLADGNRIWAWVVRIFPRAARSRADSSGRVAWTSLTAFVRATVLVAFTDAVGIMIVAAILQVPFVFAIGVLVFIGAFIPMIGALLSGSVAVLVALVAQGPVVALIMLGGVVAVQQLEAHVLQPFLMGRLVSVHPLGVIVAIAVRRAGRRHRRRAGRRPLRRGERRGLHLADDARTNERLSSPVGDSPDRAGRPDPVAAPLLRLSGWLQRAGVGAGRRCAVVRLAHQLVEVQHRSVAPSSVQSSRAWSRTCGGPRTLDRRQPRPSSEMARRLRVGPLQSSARFEQARSSSWWWCRLDGEGVSREDLWSSRTAGSGRWASLRIGKAERMMSPGTAR